MRGGTVPLYTLCRDFVKRVRIAKQRKPSCEAKSERKPDLIFLSQVLPKDQIPDASDCLLCKGLRFREIQLRQLCDREFLGFPIIHDLAPFAVVVRLIGVGNGGFCLFQSVQPYRMQKAALDQRIPHLIQGAVIDVLRRLRGSALVAERKRLKGLFLCRSEAVFAEAQMQ